RGQPVDRGEDDDDARVRASVIDRAARRLVEVTLEQTVDRLRVGVDHEAEEFHPPCRVRRPPHLPAPPVDIIGEVLGDHDPPPAGPSTSAPPPSPSASARAPCAEASLPAASRSARTVSAGAPRAWAGAARRRRSSTSQKRSPLRAVSTSCSPTSPAAASA